MIKCVLSVLLELFRNTLEIWLQYFVIYLAPSYVEKRSRVRTTLLVWSKKEDAVVSDG